MCMLHYRLAIHLEHATVSPKVRILLYGGVNVIALAPNLLTAWLLTEWGMQYLLATICGYVVHIAGAFVLNHTWTFKHSNASRGKAVARTTLVHIGSFTIVMLVTPLCVEVFGTSFIVARLTASVYAGIWDYLLDSHFTFEVHPFR